MGSEAPSSRSEVLQGKQEGEAPQTRKKVGTIREVFSPAGPAPRPLCCGHGPQRAQGSVPPPAAPSSPLRKNMYHVLRSKRYILTCRKPEKSTEKEI